VCVYSVYACQILQPKVHLSLKKHGPIIFYIFLRLTWRRTLNYDLVRSVSEVAVYICVSP